MKARYECQHAWKEPGDAWVVKTYIRPDYRVMRCLLCNKGRVEVKKYGEWNPLDQLEFGWEGRVE